MHNVYNNSCITHISGDPLLPGHLQKDEPKSDVLSICFWLLLEKQHVDVYVVNLTRDGFVVKMFCEFELKKFISFQGYYKMGNSSSKCCLNFVYH